MLFSGSTARSRSSTGTSDCANRSPEGHDGDHPAALGRDVYLITVKPDVARGLPSSSGIVGLPRAAVKEGRERIVAAPRNSGFKILPRRVTTNLSPGGVDRSKHTFILALLRVVAPVRHHGTRREPRTLPLALLQE
jgi:hypothetical protein